MSERIGWSNLSEGQRDRYTRTLGQGNAKQAERLYTRGASLKRARGHDTGAARPAEPRPKPPAQVQRRMAKLQDRTLLNRAAAHVSANAGTRHAQPGEKLPPWAGRRSGKADTDKIREQLGGYSNEQLDRISKMTADEQRQWLRGEAGPAEAAEFWYHGSQGWGA
jgi:hypothetical protein